MGKISTYIMMLSGVILLFAYAGLLQEGTLLGTLINFLNPDTFQASSYFVRISLAISTITITGIAIGFLVQGRTELIVKGGLGTLLLGIGWSLLDIYNVIKVADSSPFIWVARLLIAPLLVVYILAVIEWITGTD